MSKNIDVLIKNGNVIDPDDKKFPREPLQYVMDRL